MLIFSANLFEKDWRKIDNYLYLVNSKALTWQDADAFCGQNSGKLLSLDTEARENIAWNVINNGRQTNLYWIGR